MRAVLVIGGLLGAGAAAAALLLTFSGESVPPAVDVAAPSATGDAPAPDVTPDDGDDDDAPADGAPRRSAQASPDTSRTGYSGTAAVRNGSRGRAARPQPRRHEEAAARYFATDDATAAALAAQLPRQRSYPEMLRLLHRIGGAPEWGSEAERDEDGLRLGWTRFDRESAKMAALLDGALAAATSGVVRQALIFHMALALPPAEALPRLRALAASSDEGDAEDALCALAFTGDEDSLARFEDLARTSTPCAAEVRVDTHRDEAALFREGRRDVLRSYRAIEVLDRRPYFKIHGLWMEGVQSPFPWAEAPGRTARPDHLVERALPAWMSRYPGHAGTDDMAYRMARLRIAQDRALEALRWASFGTTVRDGDMQEACAGLMIALVELSPRGAPVAEDVLDPAAPDRNRGLLLYLRLRRHAQDLGWRAACREAADIATTEPGLVVSAAWRERWAAPVPRGLDSGRVPVAPEDELRRVDPAPPTLQASVQCDDAVALSLAMLRRQFRAWETMAALEERRAAARGAAALDLLYAEGAVLFHEREALYPAYASHTENDSRRPGPWRLGDGDSGTERECGWLRGVLSWELAASRFEELVRLDPSHALADDAAYSAALAHMKAADDRAVRAAGEPERDRHLRAGFAAFQELVELWPSSPFAASADAALRFWRKARKDLF